MEKTPPISAIEEALKYPNGYVYEIVGKFKKNEAVPPEAIKGAWKVNKNGIIEGVFIPNPNYLPK